MDFKTEGASKPYCGRAKLNCRDIDDMVIPYILGKPIPPEAAAHIAECELCRPLAKAIRQAPQVDELHRDHRHARRVDLSNSEYCAT